MAVKIPCPKHGCGFWGIPLEKVHDLASIREEQFECCLWDEIKVKCSRNPRFFHDQRAKDCFDAVSDEIKDGLD